MNSQYDNAYADTNVYGHAVKLLQEVAREPGAIHLDFGCGYGRMAEVIRDEVGARYIGIDIDEDALVSLKERGFEVMFLDLTDPAAAIEGLEKFLPKDFPVQSMSIIDTLEHLPEPKKTIKALHEVALKHNCPLVVSVPNFSHADIGYRLAVGKFDYTEAGLLDHTHRMYFTEKGLRSFMSGNGFHEIAECDVVMNHSDQAFPKEMAPVATGTPLNQLLEGIRSGADAFGHVNQFVRMYLGGPPAVVPELIDSTASTQTDEQWFLTVVTRTQGRRIEELRETMLCLMAQEDQNFHVLIMGHNLDLKRQLAVEKVISDLPVSFQSRVELVRVEGGARALPLNEAFARSKARYVAMLDDDDIVFGHWTKTFKKLSEANRGKLLRTVCLVQRWRRLTVDGRKSVTAVGPFESPYPETFDLLDHLVENRSPLHSLAFPRSLYRDLGYRFDNELTTAEDWDFIVRVAPIAGVATSPEPTCIYRRWENGDHSAIAHDQDEWDFNYRKTLRKLDAAPILMPVGTTKKLRNMSREVEQLKAEVRRLSNAPVRPEILADDSESQYEEALRWRLHELLRSRSWRWTAPLRAIRAFWGGSRLNIEGLQLWRMRVSDLEHLIARIESSRSMRVSARLRRSGGKSR